MIEDMKDIKMNMTQHFLIKSKEWIQKCFNQ